MRAAEVLALESGEGGRVHYQLELDCERDSFIRSTKLNIRTLQVAYTRPNVPIFRFASSSSQTNIPSRKYHGNYRFAFLPRNNNLHAAARMASGSIESLWKDSSK